MSDPPDPRLDALRDATGTGQNSPDDAFEALMAGDEPVLHRQKMVWPWYFHLFMLLVTIISVIGPVAAAIASGTFAALLPALLTLGLMAFIWSMFYALRVTVTPDKASIKYGLLGPSIPIEKITHCEAEKYSIMKYGGWGVRFSFIDRSWAFNMLGDKGKAVRIHYTTKPGTTRKLIVSSLHPLVLADAINRARAAKGHAVPLESALSDAELGLNQDDVRSEEHSTLPDSAEVGVKDKGEERAAEETVEEVAEEIAEEVAEEVPR